MSGNNAAMIAALITAPAGLRCALVTDGQDTTLEDVAIEFGHALADGNRVVTRWGGHGYATRAAGLALMAADRHTLRLPDGRTASVSVTEVEVEVGSPRVSVRFAGKGAPPGNVRGEVSTP